nr:MAG TPA: hypothetical protein [Caudoviricetes sp.]
MKCLKYIIACILELNNLLFRISLNNFVSVS